MRHPREERTRPDLLSRRDLLIRGAATAASAPMASALLARRDAWVMLPTCKVDELWHDDWEEFTAGV